MSNILALSSNRWISLWIFIEITTYLFLTYSIDQIESKNKFEFLLTYFLVRFISSAIFLISIFIQLENSLNILRNNLNAEKIGIAQFRLLSMAFLLKIGSIPFHPWVFSVIENLKWKTIAVLTTIQKIIPIWALTFFRNIFLLTFVIIISLTIIIFIPLKVKRVYYFIATSATNNIIWIFMSILARPATVLVYSAIYFILTINLIHNFKKNNIKILNQNIYSRAIVISLFSIIGIPPLLGFIPKLNTIISVIITREIIVFVLIFIVISNSITTIIYIKPIITPLTLRLKNINNKNIILKKNYLLTNTIHIGWPIIIPIASLIN